MNVFQLNPLRSPNPSFFEPLRSLAGIRPGDLIEPTGERSARLILDLTGEADRSVRAETRGDTLFVANKTRDGETVLRRFDLAKGVSVAAIRRIDDTTMEIDLAA